MEVAAKLDIVLLTAGKILALLYLEKRQIEILDNLRNALLFRRFTELSCFMLFKVVVAASSLTISASSPMIVFIAVASLVFATNNWSELALVSVVLGLWSWFLIEVVVIPESLLRTRTRITVGGGITSFLWRV